MDFYNKVNKLCKQNGIATTTLAVHLGLSKAIVTNWKKTNAKPRYSTVKKIADYFGIPVDYLLEDIDLNQSNSDANSTLTFTATAPATTAPSDELSDEERCIIEPCIMNIGAKVKTLRKSLGLTQKELAEKCGYKSLTTINKIELGINSVPLTAIEKLANALHVAPSYLLGWESYFPPATTQADEIRLLNAYKALTPNMKDHLLAVAEALSVGKKDK